MVEVTVVGKQGDEKPYRNPLGAFSLGNGRLKNGSWKNMNEGDLFIGEIEELEGEYVLISPDAIESVLENEVLAQSPQHLTTDNRNSFDFYFGNQDGSPLEVKYSDRIPESEDWHFQSEPETYVVSRGRIDLGLGTDWEEVSASLEPDYIERTVEEGEIFSVPAYVPHKVTEGNGDVSMAVIREGNPVGKYWMDGSPAYTWIDQPRSPEPYQTPSNKNIPD